MKVSAHYADSAAASEPLPEHVQVWVDEENAGRGARPFTTPAYNGEKKLVLVVEGTAPAAAQHWAE